MGTGKFNAEDFPCDGLTSYLRMSKNTPESLGYKQENWDESSGLMGLYARNTDFTWPFYLVNN